MQRAVPAADRPADAASGAGTLRKYAEGDLGEDKSFYFRGPEGKLNLRAQNLLLFIQLAEGVDDDTWLHHLRQGDYARWFRDAIKDDALADEAARIEEQPSIERRQKAARRSKPRSRSATRHRHRQQLGALFKSSGGNQKTGVTYNSLRQLSGTPSRNRHLIAVRNTDPTGILINDDADH